MPNDSVKSNKNQKYLTWSLQNNLTFPILQSIEMWLDKKELSYEKYEKCFEF